jgi:hypothetical protein
MASNEIMRFRYRIGKDRSLEVIATDKICQKKKEELLAEHNGNVKVSKIVPASAYPSGAPHV